VGYHEPQPVPPKAVGPTAGGFPIRFFAFQTRLFAARKLLKKSPNNLQLIKG
jgi:hypothetical protein